MMEVNEIRIRLSSFPISHENVIVYSLQRIELDAHPHLRPIADKLDMGLDLTLLERWYPPSIDFVPDGHRYRIRENILSFLGPMSASQEIFLRNWDMDPHLESERTRKAQERLKSLW